MNLREARRAEASAFQSAFRLIVDTALYVNSLLAENNSDEIMIATCALHHHESLLRTAEAKSGREKAKTCMVLMFMTAETLNF